MPEMNNMKVGNDVYEVADPKSRGVSLTWAQYQALSYEEQHNGTAYYITDRDAIYPVDHELNANSGNAVANDVVTPHILAMENVLGAKNLLPNNQTGGNATPYQPITFTKNADGSVSFSVTGTLTSRALFLVANHLHFAANIKVNGLPNIDGCIAYLYDNTTSQYIWINENDQTVTIDSTHDYGFVIAIENTVTSGTTGVYYSMIRPAGTDPTYVPYAMTNKQLTDEVEELKERVDIHTVITVASTVTIPAKSIASIATTSRQVLAAQFKGYDDANLSVGILFANQWYSDFRIMCYNTADYQITISEGTKIYVEYY